MTICVRALKHHHFDKSYIMPWREELKEYFEMFWFLFIAVAIDLTIKAMLTSAVYEGQYKNRHDCISFDLKAKT